MATWGGINVGSMGPHTPREDLDEVFGLTADLTPYSHLKRGGVETRDYQIGPVEEATMDALINHRMNTTKGHRHSFVIVDDLAVSTTVRYLAPISWRLAGPGRWTGRVRVQVEP